MKPILRLRDLLPGPPVAAGAVLVVLSSVFVAQQNYVLFHTFAEGFAIVVAVMIFVVATRSFRYAGDNFLLFLGNAYLFVAILDAFHTLAYQGMGVFPGYTSNTPTQLWVASRYVDAVSLLIAPFYLTRRFPRLLGFSAYSILTAALLASVMWWRVFPDAFIPGQGLTPFKVGSEYLICLLLVGAIFHLRSQRLRLDKATYLYVVAAMGTTIVSELSFTLYSDVYGLMNLVGHLAKIAAYYLIYRGIVERGLDAPYLEVQRLNADLEDRVRERTAALEASNRRLEQEIVERKQAQQFRDQYVSLISHDLRAPLTIVRGSAQLLQRAADKPESIRRSSELILAGADRMNALIQDLVDTARLENGQLPLELAPLDAARFAAEIKDRLAVAPGGDRLRLEAVPSSLPLIVADRNQLERVLTNLLGNALKYTKTHVVLKTELRSNEVVFSVADQGPGIPPEMLPRIFDRFYRAGHNNKTEGSGLGLYIARLLTEAQRGRIWAESTLGRGSTFYVAFPFVSR